MQDVNFSHIENHLGPAADRFFGAGFKRVKYGTRHLSLTDTSVDSSISLSYPAGWSKKIGSGELVPHLSTIDALAIAINLCQDVLLEKFANVDCCWVRRISIKAGKKPEEDLREIQAHMHEELPQVDTQGDTCLAFSGHVGAMALQLEIVRPAAADGRANQDGSGNNYYVEGFRKRTQLIDDIVFDSPLKAISKLVVVDEEPGSARGGIEASYPQVVTPIDAFVSHLQIAQVLLYKLDNLQRGQSNTLWMRTTTITAQDPARRSAQARVLMTELKDANIVTVKGEDWRVAEIVGHLSGMTLSCSVAHLLPR
ncbi:AvrD family protein [Pseudomonas saponiphila]|uniref:Avirulence D protein (AvrD) n=1 Tax=Pseudomonas saponiphila TaxID=556534 RepID=A0A1H4K7G9_9PSED|nr:AvrD family protein [Pseudomonas saponiphila]SEB53862.1 avirulence D protein (AvrD) [Pseudomonas saponiphila]